MIRLREKANDVITRELEISRFAMQWGGLLGFLAHPLYYFVWTYLLPQPYDNLWLRLSAAILCVPLMFQKYCPKRFENHILIYWHFCLIYVLPFVCTFLTIKNSFSTMWMMTEVMMIFIMALCIDFPVLLMAYVLIGIFSGFVVAILTADSPLVLSKTDQSNLALFPIVMLCSMAFSHVFQQGRLFQKGRLFEKERLFAEKNKALQALAGSIGHEMRNPLGQIKYSLDCIEHILLAPIPDELPQAMPGKNIGELYRHVAQGQTVVKRGLQVISMILDEVHAKSIDASSFVYLNAGRATQKAIDDYSYESAAERNKVSMTIARDFTFKGNETAYLFIVFNLVKNALFYFKLHPQATLTIVIDSPVIRLRDTGPGIPAEFLGQLFDAFQTSGKSGGTGLGLAYCKRMVSAFGGSITCNSVVGEYTEFVMSFPVVSQTELDTHRQQVLNQAKLALRNKRILVVDDDALIRQLTLQMLKKFGAEIDLAEDGRIALEKLKDAKFDAIVLDINMPVQNGYETAEKIRAGVVPNHQFIPILCHSSETTDIAQAKARRAGMDGFIAKPCGQLDLVQTLADVLGCGTRQLRPEMAIFAFVGKVVLLADDNHFNRIVVGEYLQRWGMRVVIAEHGQAVLDQLEAHDEIDIVLMDLNMPGKNGFETSSAIRAKPSRHQHVPIIALTADSDEASIEAASAAGMNDFITKPVEISTLCDKLLRQFSSSHRNRSDKVISGAAIDDTSFPSSSQHKGAVSEPDTPLLNLTRLEELRRIGMLEDLPYYLEKMSVTLDRFCSSVAIQDFADMHSALHSMLGLSGEVGALALHGVIKQWYPVIKNGQFPDEDDWLERIKHLNLRTAQAIRENYIDDNARSERSKAYLP